MTLHRVPFSQTAAEIGQATDAKHDAYGRALEVVPQLLTLLLERTPAERLKDPRFLADLQCMTRILEKFCRLCGPAPEAYGENPWIDAAGYALGRGHLLKLEQAEREPLPSPENMASEITRLHEVLSGVIPGLTADIARELYAEGLRVRRD